MQRIFDEQVVSKAQEERRQLIGQPGASSWGSNDEMGDVSVDQIRADHKRMLGGKVVSLLGFNNLFYRTGKRAGKSGSDYFQTEEYCSYYFK